jgi:hypothetical protein
MTSASFKARLRDLAIGVFGKKAFYGAGYYFLLARPDFRRSIRTLQGFKDSHKGQRCFIIGNGPSLRQTDLSRLANETTFGLNRIYLLYPELNFRPTYYVVVNKLVVEQFGDEIAARVPGWKFISYDARRYIQAGSETVFLFSREGPRFYTDLTRGIWQGGTVTAVALQIAYYMGFDQVILIGIDHSYSARGRPNATVVSAGEDPNHFAPDYFGRGTRWQLPDLERSETAYRLARDQYARAGRQVLDATVGGRLTVFPKVDYLTLFET